MYVNANNARVKTINIGLFDRMARFNVALLMLTVSIATIFLSTYSPVWLSEAISVPAWTYYVVLASIYPFITAIVGYDPLYALIGKDTLESFLPRDVTSATEMTVDSK
ncbi:MAG: DUF2892 domain-containing protein [Gammaproteobacteria bacterium]|jgi:hypothetical protein